MRPSTPRSPTSSAPRTRSATWTSRSPAPSEFVTAHPARHQARRHPRLGARLRRSPRPRTPACTSSTSCTRRSTRPDEMSPYAPRIITIKIPVDQIGAVIGPKGKMINQIQDETGAEITIEDDGTIYIGATDGPKAEAARAMINAHRQPDDARGRRALPRHRRQDHHLRRVRLAGARQGRPAAHLASCGSWPAASASTTSRTSSRSATRSRSRSPRSTRAASSR